MSDAPQGPGWWLASDGKYYPPAMPPPPAAVPPPPPSPSRRRAWPWVLLGGFLLLGGCTVITAIALVRAGEEIEQNRDEAFRQTSCAVTDVTVFGQLVVTAAADNTTSKRSDFRIEYALTLGDAFLGDGTMWLTNVPAGTEATEDQHTLIDAPDAAPDGDGVVCEIVSARRTASN